MFEIAEHYQKDLGMKVVIFNLFLDFYEDAEIEEITKTCNKRAMSRDDIFQLMKMYKTQQRFKTIDVDVTAKDYNQLKKQPEKQLLKWLQKHDGSEEGMLVLFDTCIEFKIEAQAVWTLLFESIRDPR